MGHAKFSLSGVANGLFFLGWGVLVGSVMATKNTKLGIHVKSLFSWPSLSPPQK